MKKLLIPFLVICLNLFIGCEGSVEEVVDTPDPLEAVTLILPENDRQCLGQRLASEQIRVEFDWSDAPDVTSYTVELRDGVSSTTNSVMTTSSSTFINLEPGTLYTWRVTAMDNSGSSETSERFSFYTEGLVESNHVPFPAQITITENTNSTIDISWESTDLDDDIEAYQVFFGTTNPPEEVASNLTETSINLEVTAGETYFLNIRTFDSIGNYSDSRLSQIF